jgi:hypothetical protein
MPILAPVSWGELLDKITILEIKRERMEDASKIDNVVKELKALEGVAYAAGSLCAEAVAVMDELRNVNGALWDIEDDIRDCERANDFSEKFISLARSVYHTNDKRAALKRRVNDILGSDIIEEKSYQPY